jgi:hypothetical protein
MVTGLDTAEQQHLAELAVQVAGLHRNLKVYHDVNDNGYAQVQK